MMEVGRADLQLDLTEILTTCDQVFAGLQAKASLFKTRRLRDAVLQKFPPPLQEDPHEEAGPTPISLTRDQLSCGSEGPASKIRRLLDAVYKNFTLTRDPKDGSSGLVDARPSAPLHAPPEVRQIAVLRQCEGHPPPRGRKLAFVPLRPLRRRAKHKARLASCSRRLRGRPPLMLPLRRRPRPALMASAIETAGRLPHRRAGGP